MHLSEIVNRGERMTRVNQRQNVRGDPQRIGRARQHLERQTRVRPESRKWNRADFEIRDWRLETGTNEESARNVFARVQSETIFAIQCDQCADQFTRIDFRSGWRVTRRAAGVNSNQHSRQVSKYIGKQVTSTCLRVSRSTCSPASPRLFQSPPPQSHPRARPWVGQLSRQPPSKGRYRASHRRRE